MEDRTADTSKAVETERLFKGSFIAAEPSCEEWPDGSLAITGSERTIVTKARTNGMTFEVIGYSVAHEGPSFLKCINIERAGFTAQQAIELGKSVAEICRSMAEKKLDTSE